MLSPALDAATVGALLDRLDKPWLLTDGAKLDPLSGLRWLTWRELPRTATMRVRRIELSRRLHEQPEKRA